MKMPFGKHKGKELTEIPRGYLRWLQGNIELSGWLAHGVSQALVGKAVMDQPIREKSQDELVHEIVKPWDGGTQ
jgi:hypothetical protein